MKTYSGRYSNSNTYTKGHYEHKSYNRGTKFDMHVKSRRLADEPLEVLKLLTVVNTRCLYIDGTPKLLDEFKQMFDAHTSMSPFGKYEEIKVHKYADKQGGESAPAKMLYLRFKYEFQASLVYKAINNFYKDFLYPLQQDEPAPYLRSYFKKSRFCTTMLFGKKCQKRDCQYLHKKSEMARYFETQKERKYNHLYDSAMAVKIIKQSREKIQKLAPLFESVKHLRGRFCCPMQILQRLQLLDDRPSHERDGPKYYTGYSDNDDHTDSDESDYAHTKTGSKNAPKHSKDKDSDSEEYTPVNRQATDPALQR